MAKVLCEFGLNGGEAAKSTLEKEVFMKRNFFVLIGIISLFLFIAAANGAEPMGPFLTTVEKALETNPLPAGQTVQRIKLTGDDSATVLIVRIAKGGESKTHSHPDNSESVFIYKGAGQLVIDGKTMNLGAGRLHFNPKGNPHAVKNIGNGEMIAVSIFTPALKAPAPAPSKLSK